MENRCLILTLAFSFEIILRGLCSNQDYNIWKDKKPKFIFSKGIFTKDRVEQNMF